MTDPLIHDYEVFQNDKNAIAFFFHVNEELDQNDAAGPFWFSIHDDAILAGTEDHHVTFAGLKPEIVEAARQRGVIMLMEFEDRAPVRCTPCYFSDTL